jgi:hypothetical protein
MVVPISIPIHYLPDETTEISLTLLLETFAEKTAIIYQAILLEKRIVFCGHSLPAWLTCKYVLSACLLGKPIENILRQRAYPYVNFGSTDFLNTDGYILGVANPFLRDKGAEYWDVFCDIGSREVITESPANTTLLSSVIKVFRQEITDTAKPDPTMDLVKRTLLGMHRGYGEPWLRQQFRKHTLETISNTLRTEMTGEGTSSKDKEGLFRDQFVHQFKTKRGYQSWANENNHLLSQVYPGSAPISKALWDLTQMIKKLKTKLSKNGNLNVTNSWMIVVTQKIFEVAIDDDTIMEAFTILAENRLSLAERISRNPQFPEDLKHTWLNLEARHQYILSTFIKHEN